MAQALVVGMAKGDKSLEIFTYTPSFNRANDLALLVKGKAFQNCEDMPPADIYLVACKPQQLDVLASSFSGLMDSEATVISILAGTTVDTIKNKFKVKKVIRVMPNTPCLVGAGVNAVYFCPEVDGQIAFKVQALLEKTSSVYVFDEENQIDAVTPFSGSGPAYLFELARIMADKLKGLGIDPHDSEMIVKETLYGSAKLLRESNDSAEVLRNNVTSKGGVTFEALKVLESNDLSGIFGKALDQAHNRAKELSK